MNLSFTAPTRSRWSMSCYVTVRMPANSWAFLDIFSEYPLSMLWAWRFGLAQRFVQSVVVVRAIFGSCTANINKWHSALYNFWFVKYESRHLHLGVCQARAASSRNLGDLVCRQGLINNGEAYWTVMCGCKRILTLWIPAQSCREIVPSITIHAFQYKNPFSKMKVSHKSNLPPRTHKIVGKPTFVKTEWI